MDQSPQKTNYQPYIIDRMRGCILGALLGDALGAPLEFTTGLSLEKVNHAMTLPGGGVRPLGEGQITDDGELTLSLLHALCNCQKQFNIDQVAIAFGQWFNSKPFDVGNTIRYSIKRGIGIQQHQAHCCIKAAQKHNATSQSNGSMMLISPMALYLSRHEFDKVQEIVRQVTSLIHPAEIVQLCNVFYVTTMITLLMNENVTRRQAYDRSKELLKTENLDFKQFLMEIENPNLMIPPYPKSGWIRIAFTYSFSIFLEDMNYSDSLRKMLLYGGDTDTNACILGALIGSTVGESQIDKKMLEKLLAFNGKGKGIPRPNFLIPHYVFEDKMTKLFKIIDQYIPQQK